MVLGLLLFSYIPAYGQVIVVQAPLLGATGEQRVIVILVNFLDKTSQPFSIATANDVVFNQTNAYYSEASYQKTWLSGTVVGWYTLPITIGTSCPTDQIFNEAVKAADPSVNFNNYSRIMVMFPGLAGCNFGGQGTLGKNTVTTNDGTISASKAWINYDLPDLGVVGHELGHNLGVHHANALDCGAEVVTTETVSSAMTTCKDYEYGDFIDIMGVPSDGHMNASFKNKLGWFDTANVVTLGTSMDAGTYTLNPLESFSTGIQLIRVLRGVDSLNRPNYYNIEYRQPIGQDSFLSTNSSSLYTNYTNSTKGALIHLDYDTTASYASQTRLLDMTPNSDTSPCYTRGCADSRDGSLGINKTFTDPTGIQITPIAMSSSSLTVNVNFPLSPRVLITNPPNGAFIRGIYNLTASVISGQTISRTDFYADGVYLGTDTVSPYSLAWDTANNGDGPHLLTAMAQDISSNQGVSPMVNVTVDNTPPVVSIASPSNGSTVSGQVQVTVNASDVTSGISNVFFVVDGIIINFYDRTTSSPYIFTWDTANEANGVHTLTAYAIDLAGNRSNNQNIAVTLTTSQPPVLAAIGNKSVNEGSNLSFTISATDPDGGTLTYSATGLPTGAVFNVSTRVFSWTPTYVQAGSYSVTFTVTDAGGLSDSETTVITANNVNRPPVLNTIGNKTITVGQSLTFSVSATDPDGDALTYSASGLPAGATFNASTRVFSWTPAAGQAGSYNITFTVTDSRGLSNSETITIAVTAPVQLARITTPAPGSQITTSSVTFGWSANPASTQYYLWAGTAPNTNNLRNLNAGTNTSITTTVPLDGTLLYVSVWSLVNGVWVKDHEVSYTRSR